MQVRRPRKPNKERIQGGEHSAEMVSMRRALAYLPRSAAFAYILR